MPKLDETLIIFNPLENIKFIFNLDFLELTLPIPLHTFNDLKSSSKILSYRKELSGKSGIYAFINLINGKQYIGSAINIYKRFLDHINSRRSNLPLQQDFKKYGIENFKFIIYVYAPYVLPDITNLETYYISSFSFDMLYNIFPIGKSIYGYKHNQKTIEKMKTRYLNTNNHPMFGKTHTEFSKILMSKPGNLNPMFGKVHSTFTKNLISNSKSTHRVLFDNKNNYFLTFKNNIELSKFLGCHKNTVGKYIKSGKLYKNLYYIKNKIK